ncbi:hypothetical protein [Nonomuraea insulae]|uniref:Uncharacterized protein n=1 Tax=Nonomuraea insulae TaxID=1616787 RepID=A0ABW1D3N5_9ACTN
MNGAREAAGAGIGGRRITARPVRDGRRLGLLAGRLPTASAERNRRCGSRVSGSSSALGWGIHIDRVEIKDVQLPESMKRSMSRQAEAERTPTPPL